MVEIESGLNDWYRVCIEINDAELYILKKENLDKYVRNPLESLNILVQIIVNGKKKYSIHPPLSLSGRVWDLVFINGSTEIGRESCRERVSSPV